MIYQIVIIEPICLKLIFPLLVNLFLEVTARCIAMLIYLESRA